MNDNYPVRQSLNALCKCKWCARFLGTHARRLTKFSTYQFCVGTDCMEKWKETKDETGQLHFHHLLQPRIRSPIP